MTCPALSNRPCFARSQIKAGLDYVTADFDGVPFIPPLHLTGEKTASWTYIGAGVGFEWAGDQDAGAARQLPTGGYTTFNLRGALKLSELGYGEEGTQLFVEIRNATDKEVRLATSVLKDLIPAPGRNIQTGLRVTF